MQDRAGADAECLGDDDRVERRRELGEPGDPKPQWGHVGRGEQFLQVANRYRAGDGLALLGDQQVRIAVVTVGAVGEAAAKFRRGGRVERGRLGPTAELHGAAGGVDVGDAQVSQWVSPRSVETSP